MLELCGVSKVYGGGTPVTALHPTDLLIAQGDFLAVTGRSGSGKSTLLNVLGLLDAPTAGDVRLHDVSLRNATEGARAALRAQLFGFVFQAFHLLADRSARENVELAMLYRGRREVDRRRRADEALDRVGLSARRHHDPGRLSGGEQQRVAIARAIAGGPAILLCDEPTGNLDSRSADAVLQVLSTLHGDGLTVVVVTHDESVAGRAGRRVTVEDGEVRAAHTVGTGTP